MSYSVLQLASGCSVNLALLSMKKIGTAEIIPFGLDQVSTCVRRLNVAYNCRMA